MQTLLIYATMFIEKTLSNACFLENFGECVYQV